MALRKPKAGGKDFKPFWGCSDYPDCRGTRNIMESGKPETDVELEWEQYDSDDMEWHPGHPSNYGDK